MLVILFQTNGLKEDVKCTNENMYTISRNVDLLIAYQIASNERTDALQRRLSNRMHVQRASLWNIMGTLQQWRELLFGQVHVRPVATQHVQPVAC